MKKSIALALFIIVIGFNSYGQFNFGVAPGLGTNSAYFGYKFDKVVPYAALQVLSGNFKINSTDRYNDGSEWVTDKMSASFNVHAIMPTIGVKYFAIDAGDLKGYFNLAGTKPFLMGKGVEDGSEIEEFFETFDKISIIGAELGFGVEYFLSSNFSIGGEYALRYLSGSYTDKTKYTHNGDPATETTKYSVGFVPTVAKVTLNYYFGGGGGN